MSTELMKGNEAAASQIERVLVAGDLATLNAAERVSYYKMVCESVGLNPLTKPFEYITLNSKLTLYARKDCTDQLRKIHNVSVTIAARELTEDCYVVTTRATLPSGRTDESIGAVSVGTLKGEAKCNGFMKAETKAKRRVTLSICGLGMLDETEIETIPNATKAPLDVPRTTEAIPLIPGENVLPPATDRITPEQSGTLHRRFRESLPLSMRTEADALLHDWLGSQMYLDESGNPSALAIKKEEYATVGKAAVAHARELAK